MKVSDEMVEAGMREMFVSYSFSVSWPEGVKEGMRSAIEAALRVQAMEQIIEAGAEQMDQEERK